MSEQAAKRQETMAMASGSVPAILSLPPELLETIFGFLKARARCTARLVCAHFRNVASSRLHSVELSVETLRSRPETHLNNFPNLSRVSVFDVKEGDLLVLAQSPVTAAVTHLRAVEFLRLVPQRALSQAMSPVARRSLRLAAGRTGEPLTAAGPPVLPLPNLMSLTVRCERGGPAFPFPETLRELVLDGPASLETWQLVPGLSNLTCLRIDARGFSYRRFKAVTALTGLQRLDICSSFSVAPFLAELPLLTHLQFQGIWGRSEDTDLAPLLASLSRLHRLVHLGVKPCPHLRERQLPPSRAALERQVLASVAMFTSLRSLDLELCRQPERSAFETVGMAPFSRLTALSLQSASRGVDASFLGASSLHASFLPRFNLKRLRDLTLSEGVELDRDGVAALRRATGLTHLSLCTTTVGPRVGPGKWRTALSRMSRLHALSLGVAAEFQATVFLEAISPLTKLTRLTLSGGVVNSKAVVRVCRGLKKLRVLSIPSDYFTSEAVFAMAMLRQLRKFNVGGIVRDFWGELMDNARARVDAKRHEKGWPPLELSVPH